MIAHEIKNMNEYSNSERSYGSGGVVPSAAPGAVRCGAMGENGKERYVSKQYYSSFSFL